MDQVVGQALALYQKIRGARDDVEFTLAAERPGAGRPLRIGEGVAG